MTEKNKIYNKTSNYFDEKIKEFGCQPKGLDWNDRVHQTKRFDQLMMILPINTPFTLTDVGCGYGELYTYVIEKSYKMTKYTGYDFSKKQIEAAIDRHKEYSINQPIFKHTTPQTDYDQCDYFVASGIFNMKQDISSDDWTVYIKETIDKINEKSIRGFAFNMLTSYSDEHKKRKDLYYGDPLYFFDLCKKKYSINVSLIHDYGLYDYTILVKKEV